MKAPIFSFLLFTSIGCSLISGNDKELFTIKDEDELWSSCTDYSLSYRSLRAYKYLVDLGAEYEKAKLNQPDDDFSIPNEERQIKATQRLLKQVVEDLQKEYETNENPDLLIPLFLKCYNFDNPTTHIMHDAALFEEFNNFIRDQVGEEADNDPFFKNILRLNKLMHDRIRMGIKIVKYYPRSSFETIKTGLNTFTHTFPLIEKAIAWAREINPAAYLVSAGVALGLGYGAYRMKYSFSKKNSVTPLDFIRKPLEPLHIPPVEQPRVQEFPEKELVINDAVYNAFKDAINRHHNDIKVDRSAYSSGAGVRSGVVGSNKLSFFNFSNPQIQGLYQDIIKEMNHEN